MSDVGGSLTCLVELNLMKQVVGGQVISLTTDVNTDVVTAPRRRHTQVRPCGTVEALANKWKQALNEKLKEVEQIQDEMQKHDKAQTAIQGNMRFSQTEGQNKDGEAVLEETVDRVEMNEHITRC